MNLPKSLFLAFLFSILLSFYGFAQAATIQVTTTTGGDCVNPTYNSCTLQQALFAAETNTQEDTIHIAAGTYSITANGGNPFSYSASNPETFALTLTGDGIGATILDGDLVDQVMGIKTGGLTSDATVHILIKGITFKRGKPAAANGGALGFDSNQASLTVEDCAFEDNDNSGGNNGGGANAFTDSGTITFARNRFKHNTTNNNGGGLSIFSDTGVAIIDNNIFDNNEGNNNGGGLVVFDLNSATTNITNNVFFNDNHSNASGSSNGGGGAAFFMDSGTLNFSHNTLDGNSSADTGGGLKVFADSDSAVINIFNNIFHNNTSNSPGDDCSVDDSGILGGATVRFSNNNAAEFDCTGVCAGNLTEANILNLDPLFLDAGNGDFHLLPTSPLIDQGDPAPPAFPATDFEGDLRKLGTAPDLGADETTCGDGSVDTGVGEECDDGNNTSGDCCDSTCQFETQGDSCDDGDSNTINDACTGTGNCEGNSISAPSGGCGLVPSGEKTNFLTSSLFLLAFLATFGMVRIFRRFE